MKFSFRSIALCPLFVLPAGAAVIMPSGNSITGTTTTITLNAGSIVDNPNNNTTLSNTVGGSLVVQLNTATSGGLTDYYLTWAGAGDGLGFNTASFGYVQVDIEAVSPGLTETGWQLFWQDDDSGIGGPNNSSLNIGDVDPTVGAPFSFVIDLTAVNGSTGAKGWGPGILDTFRLDPFQNAPAGESFTISAITFGSDVVPEPSGVLLTALGSLSMLLRRRR